MTTAASLWLLATIPVFLAAASMSRFYVATDKLWAVGVMLVLYAVGNLMMVRLMRESGLAVAISVSSIAQLVLVNLVAFLVFDERLPPMQLAGMALGTVGLVLMMWPETAP
ncbi:MULTISPECIES: hypothetical protein [unclassified Aureimonas]|uniref:hypothetical protein n=1 Tax=unclassified Aureimonas TaxID=2615206 RepID=UPI0006F32AA6|nr:MULTISPECIES: hypothetical protein [unclassified Aureimonas]KQT66258.1 hypothetical protein ASG62_19720 [Aureimonas sp. Leaf427]KQT72447.1 hypothetical protein ASG54_04090 [Aureimonas sp. Leaf460]